MTAATYSLDWFETFYGGLKTLQHKKLAFQQPPEIKQKFLQEIIPSIVSLGREHYNCSTVYHPGIRCRAYIMDKLVRALINGLKICSIAQLLPNIFRLRKQLFSNSNKNDAKKRLKTALDILIGYIRATLYISLGTGLPFVLCCLCPLWKGPFSFLPTSFKITINYALLPCSMLIIEETSRITIYMGFFVSKAFSLAWALLKTKSIVPSQIPFEKEIQMALLAGLIGFLSVK